MKKPIAVAAAVVAAVAVAASALAITYGEYDGNGHPNVGAMIIQRPSDGQFRLICSGSLISPTVFLTASHCTAFAESLGLTDAYVTFDPTFDSKSNLLHGTMHTNPAYNQSQGDPDDIAVITLDKQVDLAPVELPKAGLLDQKKSAGTLNGTRFTSVGYGVQQPNNGPGGHTFPFTSQRWVSSGEFNSLTKAWLRISQNASTGDGGTCFGDSGGPQFLGSGTTETPTQVSITITGDSVCKATNVDYRLDTPQARAFLGGFVALP